MRKPGKSASLISKLLIILLTTGGIFLSHCKKFEISRVVIVKTEGVSEITTQSCKVAGTLVDVGSTGLSDHGFCWSLTSNPAEAINCSQQGIENEKVSFSTEIQNLNPETKYYFWAYGSVEGVKTYGEPGEFTTLAAQLPDIETGIITGISTTSAKCEYKVLSDGGSPVTIRGLCWSTEPLTSLADAENHTEEGSGTGTYTGTMGGLTPETDYYVRAYATNAKGKAYGDQKTFGTDPEPKLPELETSSPKNLTEHSVILGGTILHEGFAEITAKGIYWSTEPDPGADDQILPGGSGANTFELSLGDLASSTVFYYKAYAENSAGIGMGDTKEFKTLFVPGDLFTDERDNQQYPTVLIGEQCWMVKNMNIGIQTDTSVQQISNDEIEKYCYNNDAVNCNEYGGLYTWDEMMQYSTVESAQGVCPDGWHIPSDGEWMILEKHLGILEADLEVEAYRGTNQGGMLKTADKPPWEEPNTLATNSTQFSALPSGMIFPGNSTSTGMGYYTVYWVSNPVDADNAIFRMLHSEEGGIGRFSGYRPNTTSVRCVRD